MTGHGPSQGPSSVKASPHLAYFCNIDLDANEPHRKRQSIQSDNMNI